MTGKTTKIFNPKEWDKQVLIDSTKFNLYLDLKDLSLEDIAEVIFDALDKRKIKKLVNLLNKKL